jgi:uncharacterized membrane-anchored protein
VRPAPSHRCDSKSKEIGMLRTFDVRWMAMVATAWLLVLGGGAAVEAQEPEAETPAPVARPGWTKGPHVGTLGSQAQIAVPSGSFFLDAAATRAFLQANENIPSGNELGAIVNPVEGGHPWFALFTFSDEGYVEDTDKDAIDADALLANMKAGNAEANEERKKRGWTPFVLEGWATKPYYDATTHNLTWAIRGSSPGETATINHSVRLLGRRGVMSVQLVADQEGIATTTGDFNTLLKGFAYNPGERYAEFRKGDKMAGYGLAALIGGGAVAAAAKTGLLQKAWKFLVLIAVAAFGALKKLFTGRGQEADASVQPPPVP